LKAHVLNCEAIDWEAGTASGYMSPPSRPVTKLFNLAAVDSWSGCLERLHAGDPVFRAGFGWDSVRDLSDSTSWDDDPLHCLHVCFLARSSKDEASHERLNLNESGAYNRTLMGTIKRHFRRATPPAVAKLHREGGNWKRNWYARGALVSVNAVPFLASLTM
jgi:hypothetical protein